MEHKQHTTPHHTSLLSRHDFTQAFSTGGDLKSNLLLDLVKDNERRGKLVLKNTCVSFIPNLPSHKQGERAQGFPMRAASHVSAPLLNVEARPKSSISRPQGPG